LKRVLIAAVLIAAVALAGLGLWYLTGPPEGLPFQSDSIVVAYSPFESCALFLIAEDRQFFAQNGLSLSLYRSDSGAAALDDMLSGKADLAVSVSEFPLVRKTFQGTSARAMASMDKAEYIFIVARKDRGIRNPPDLQGKRIGTVAGSIAEFYLGRFLSLQGLGIGDVEYVSIRTPPETANALVDGDIDAAVLAQPYADLARDSLGGNAISWPAQSNQPLYALVVSTEGWIAEHPEEVTRFLKALSLAEEYALLHPDEARAIVQRSLNLDPSSMDAVWRQNQFSLTLDQSLITAMEDEARWMIANNLTNGTAVPDFREYVSTDGLKAVKPGAVNVIR
jgi:NitT/TauT family transport system substrate-binding protein